MSSPGSPTTVSHRKRQRRGPLTVGMCFFLSTTALLSNLNLIKRPYNPSIHRQILITSAYNVSEAPSFPKQANASHSLLDVDDTNSSKPLAKPKGSRRKLDFLIAGFAKSGTTTLVYAFANHNETDISMKEKCQIGGSNLAAGPAYAKLTEVVQDLSPDPTVQRGIKCPMTLRSHRTLSLLVRHSPETKLIIGVRHPVRFLESHYNYRITELYDKNQRTNIPPIETLVNDEWRGVSTRNARFEIPLMQLGKTNMTTMEIQKLGLVAHSAVVPNRFKVFIYSLEQMKDTNVTRTDSLLHDLETFMELKQPLKPFGHENLNHFVGENSYKETIDICNDKYIALRTDLITKGQETQLWLRNKFLKSPDVTVANRDHFLELLDSWGSDPCATSKATVS